MENIEENIEKNIDSCDIDEILNGPPKPFPITVKVEDDILNIKVDMNSRCPDAKFEKDMVFYGKNREELIVPKTTKLYILSCFYYFILNNHQYRMFYNSSMPDVSYQEDGFITLYNETTGDIYMSGNCGEYIEFFEDWSTVPVEKINYDISPDEYYDNYYDKDDELPF